ncbi:hypothetical protein [Aurantimonas sp. 22II-16-19i]|uniref:hypothetical protein n=1 Tax=Aurantimonas sp. 22II-16-19i TaxID=1317114 RepID=UPI00111C5FA4|nr:hypothetical protein [Aurantimonas sp. 22II-16-19i]
MEMSANETLSLDIPYLELIAENQLKPVLADRDLGRFVTKIGSLAMLERDEAYSKMRKFSHSEIFYYYLARGLVSEVTLGHFSGAARRGVVGLEVQGIICDILRTLDEDQFSRFHSAAHRELEKGAFGRFGQNVFGLCLTTLGRSVGDGNRVYKDASIEEACLPDEVLDCQLQNIFFLRLDVRGSNCSALSLDSDCAIETLILDEATTFPFHANINHVEFHRANSITSTRDPDEIAKFFTHSSLENDSDSRSPAVKLLERLCRLFMRQYWLKLDPDDHAAKSFMRDPLFDDLLRVLESHERIIEDPNIGAGGTPARFIHMRRPESLLKFESLRSDDIRLRDDVRSLWREGGGS